MTDGILAPRESARFLEVVQDLPRLGAGELQALNLSLPRGALAEGKPGIF
jgi:2-methylcitrate dehydratase